MEKQVGWGLGIAVGLSAAILVSLLISFVKKEPPDKQNRIRIILDVGVLFLPAIPAYLWVWPNIQGGTQNALQIIAYIYVLVGTVLIGLRHYNWNQLGLNHNGIRSGLVYGLLLIIGRTLVILAVDWQAPIPALKISTMLGDLAFCVLIGITEELLFRGLLYRVLQDWRSVRWAIWGSSIGFVLWHIFGQGPLVGAAMLLYGLVFALMRWRAGGIIALIITHTLVDFFGFQMLPTINIVDLGRPEVPHPLLLLAGLVLIVAVPIILWLGHGKVFKTYADSI